MTVKVTNGHLIEVQCRLNNTAKTHTTSKVGAASFGVLHKLAAKTLTAVNGGATVVT